MSHSLHRWQRFLIRITTPLLPPSTPPPPHMAEETCMKEGGDGILIPIEIPNLYQSQPHIIPPIIPPIDPQQAGIRWGQGLGGWLSMGLGVWGWGVMVMITLWSSHGDQKGRPCHPSIYWLHNLRRITGHGYTTHPVTSKRKVPGNFWFLHSLVPCAELNAPENR